MGGRGIGFRLSSGTKPAKVSNCLVSKRLYFARIFFSWKYLGNLVFSTESRTCADLFAVVVSAGKLAERIGKTDARELFVREIIFTNESDLIVRLVLWNDQAKTFGLETCTVILEY